MSCKGQEMPTLGILGMTAHKIGKLAQTMYAEYDLNKSQSMILFQLHRDGRISQKERCLNMELNFIKCGDYYIPDIKVKNPNIRLGKWGRMRKEYLRLANPVLFSDMVLNETLYEHCAEIEETAKKRMEIIVPQLAKAYGVTEQLKAENQIEWVRQMNACVAQAEEAIKGELIYAD